MLKVNSNRNVECVIGRAVKITCTVASSPAPLFVCSIEFHQAELASISPIVKFLASKWYDLIIYPVLKNKYKHQPTTAKRQTPTVHMLLRTQNECANTDDSNTASYWLDHFVQWDTLLHCVWWPSVATPFKVVRNSFPFSTTTELYERFTRLQ